MFMPCGDLGVLWGVEEGGEEETTGSSTQVPKNSLGGIPQCECRGVLKKMPRAGKKRGKGWDCARCPKLTHPFDLQGSCKASGDDPEEKKIA